MKKFLLALVALLIIAVVVVYLSLNVIVKRAVNDYGHKVLGVGVSLGGVNINPLEGKLSLYNLKIRNPRGFEAPYALQFNTIAVNMDINTIFSDVMRFNHITIVKPVITYEIGPGGDNIDALNARVKRNTSKLSSSSSKSKPKKEKKVMIYHFNFNDATVKAAIQKLGKRSVNLPDIYLKDLGVSEGGITVPQAMAQIMFNINRVINKTNLKSLTVEDVKKTIEGAKEQIQKEGRKLREIRKQLKGDFKGILKGN